MAAKFKTEGNTLFKSKDFAAAVDKYSKGIELCPPEAKDTLTVLYQNRAAAFEALNDLAKCQQDCDEALRVNPRYVKALLRRSRVREQRGDPMGALKDMTVASSIEKKPVPETFARAQSMLMKLSTERAELFMGAREPVMPPKTFVKSFFALFSSDPLVNGGGEAGGAEAAGGDSAVGECSSKFAEARKLYKEARYKEVLSTLTALLEDASSPHRREALVSRGIFHLLRGATVQALKDLNEVIDDKDSPKDLRVNALIKRATVHLFNDDLLLSRKSLDEAVDSSQAKNPDALLHRGQLRVFQEDFKGAIKDFENARSCGAGDAVVEMQKAFSEVRHKLKDGPNAMRSAVEKLVVTCEKFPDNPEALVLCAQSLSVQGQPERAVELFKKVLALEPENIGIEVHLVVLEGEINKDLAGAVTRLEALSDRDPLSQVVYETLGSLYLRLGRIKKALKAFDRALVVAHNPKEIKQLLMLKTVTEIQVHVIDHYPDLAASPLQFMQGTPKF